jgi:hypothetical protein
MDPATVIVDGFSYNVVHVFRANRALINYEGLFVLVDMLTDGTWELSGEPASDEEEVVLKTFTAPMNDKTVVTITKDP